MTVVDEIKGHGVARSGHPAIIEQLPDGRSSIITYGDLKASVEAISSKIAGAGFGSGDRFGLQAPQGVEFIEQALAILDAGLCLVPISDDYAGAALGDFIGKSALHGMASRADGYNPRRLPAPMSVDGNGDRDFRSLSPAYIRFTSGTTNERKGVILSHQSIQDRLASANKVLRIGPEDRIMWLLPMAHHFVVSILLYLKQGATILLPAGHWVDPVMRLARQEKATVFYASPHQYALLAGEEADPSGFADVRLAVSTATGLTEDVAGLFLERTGVALSQALGVIEMGLPVINTERAGRKPLSLGQVLPDYRVWLRADDGSEVVGQGAEKGVGEICIQGPGAFDAYLNPWTPATRAMGAEGFRTGDFGYFDGDGDLFLLGRQQNRINSAGMKFFSEEVEAVLNMHPSIQESRVRGEAHADFGEIPVADLVLKAGRPAPDQKEIAAFCRNNLSLHKIPVRICIVSDLPKTPTGKVRRW